MTNLHKSAAAKLLDREIPADYLDDWTGIVATEQTEDKAETKSVLVFRIGAEWLALSTSIFEEVTEPTRVHKLPHHRGAILKGLVNVRGELVICVRLEVLLGLDEISYGVDPNGRRAPKRLLICDRGGERAGFLVDEVHGVIRFRKRDLRDVPSTVSKSAAAYSAGILHWQNRSVGYLDDELLFFAVNKGLA
jgi:chemotaxis-related protein WspD